MRWNYETRRIVVCEQRSHEFSCAWGCKKKNMHVCISDLCPWQFVAILFVYCARWGCSIWFSNVGSSNLTVLTVCLMVCCTFVFTVNLSTFVWLEPAEACTAEVAAYYLLQWCETLRVRRMYVSDTATHLKNQVQQSRSRARCWRCNTNLMLRIPIGRTVLKQWLWYCFGRLGWVRWWKYIRRSLFGRYNFLPPEFAVKELRRLASDMVSLIFEACEFALVFCWL